MEFRVEMAQFNIPVEHLFSLTLEGHDRSPFNFEGPFGRRRFAKFTGGAATGANFEGKVLPLLATDYGRAATSGDIFGHEASVVLETSDGAIVLMHDASERGTHAPVAADAIARIVAAGREARMDVVPLEAWIRAKG